MLVDAAKHGDVEIPVFCYEPKLGQPVGACRMCLVEIEGIPKLQTGCSTPVKDGMVVHTQTDARARRPSRRSSSSCSSTTRSTARSATRAASARCRTSRSAGAAARSRFIEPKRHFVKPLELSPLIAIDRERCILCYRCVRFSQEVAEDYQLVLARARRAHLRRHVRRPPVRRAVQRQHHRAVPGGRADVAALPLPRAPVGHRGRRLAVHAVPVAVQRHLHRPRRPRAARARARPRRASTTAGCATRAASPTRRSTPTSASRTPMIRDGGELRPVRWERALEEAAAGAAARAKGKVARAGRRRRHQRGGLPARAPRARGARLADVESRARAGRRRRAAPRALGHPSLQATVPDIEFAHAVLVLDTEPVDDMPILDLRIRKGVRRNQRQARRRDEPAVVAGPERRGGRALRARRAARRSSPR